MKALNLKPNHKAIRDYYEAITKLASEGISHEGAVSPAFAQLLRHCATQLKLTLIEKHPMKRNSHIIIVDGLLNNEFNVPHGYWEAKDTRDDLEVEVKKKFAAGYPKNNILFQAPNHAIIWQDGKEVFNEDIGLPEHLIDCLRTFFEHQPPAIEEWQKAAAEFRLKVPEIATGLLHLIEREQHTNKRFIEAFGDFCRLCQETINPNISTAAVEEMLIQHILTERIFRKIFNNPSFAERNAIAHEIEKVISALTSQSFSRDDFIRSLDRFYIAIESAAATIIDFNEKQTFLNTVYEKFFQGFSVKVADTHGIVYTPPSIVNFMVNSIEHILEKEFGRSLSDSGVHIIDPFVGTGNFIIHIMRNIQRVQLPYKYNNELYCNEVLLLPYYISSMNIEHEYYELSGRYEPFIGICLVDTFDITEKKEFSFFVKENTARVRRQQSSPIFVIIGNPPYNAGQVNENDNNKNRKYPVIDKRVSDTYAKGSKATLLRKLNDPYIKAIRWATDRIGDEGIVAFINNNSFVSETTFDGMRKHLAQDFNVIYVMDLCGNVRKNPKLSGTTHNVFGIQVGVSINILIKKKDTQWPKQAKIYYARVDELWRKEQKYEFLIQRGDIKNIDWKEITPDQNYTWLTEGLRYEFESLIPIGTREAKKCKEEEVETIFKLFSLGVSTNRDVFVYNYDKQALTSCVEHFAEDYNAEVDRYKRDKPEVIDDFVKYDRIKWSRNLKRHLRNNDTFVYDENNIRMSMYRPFTKKWLYFSDIIIDEQGTIRRFFPTSDTENQNRVICVPSVGGRTSFSCLCVAVIPNLTLTSVDANQCFPFYNYDENGQNRQENITNWALEQFQKQYKDSNITKLDIFHYIYAVLHHPEYREKYAANLKRELPRIPFAPEFHAFAQAGAKLAELHVNYEQQAEYPLKWIENKDASFSYLVDKMKLSRDKTQVIFNDFLALGGIPPEAFEYRLGNRSALEWVIDQYQVKTDKRSGIANDPNRPDDEQYIIRLIGKIATVSLETIKLVKSLPAID